MTRSVVSLKPNGMLFTQMSFYVPTSALYARKACRSYYRRGLSRTKLKLAADKGTGQKERSE